MKAILDRILRDRVSAPNVIGLSGGLPAVIQFPRRELVRSFLDVIKDPMALQYGWPEGEPRLREQVALRLRARGGQVAPDDVLITNGAQQAIAIAAQLVCKAGDAIEVDAETYPSALELFRSQKLVPVVNGGARVAYVMPAIGNPRGRPLSAPLRDRLLGGEDRIIIEDDAYAELTFSGPPGPTLMAGSPSRTLHVGTLSKILCPGLRVGWLVVPARYRGRARRLKQASDLQAGGLAQAVASNFLARDDLELRLVRLRRFYRARCHRLLEALSKFAPSWRYDEPLGGFSVWVETDGQVQEDVFLSLALDEGVSFDPGSSFRPNEADLPLAFRLCFSSAHAELFEEGIQCLVKAWRRATWKRRSQRVGGRAATAPRGHDSGS